jgi:hypothetical protein
MDIRATLKGVEKFTLDNSPQLLTAAGVVGTITTAYLTGKATFKAAKLISDREFVLRTRADTPISVDDVKTGRSLDTNDKVKLVWKMYIPPALSGALTISVIISANRVGNRRAVAMAAAYALTEQAFTEYREKIVEKLGSTKEQRARDEIAQDRIDRNPPSKAEIFITGNGDVLCYDMYTGRYFSSNMESIKGSLNEVNYMMLHEGYASLNDFYGFLGLPSVSLGEEVGWTTDRLLELRYSTTMSE